MQELMVFVSAHWMLSAAFMAILGMLIWSYAAPLARGVAELKPADAVEMINRQEAVVLDVRSDNEFLEGHIVNAVHIPQSFLANRMQELEQYRDRPVVLVCRTGSRSSVAASQLRKHGFAKVFNLAGGLMAWQQASLPLAKKKK